MSGEEIEINVQEAITEMALELKREVEEDGAVFEDLGAELARRVNERFPGLDMEGVTVTAEDFDEKVQAALDVGMEAATGAFAKLGCQEIVVIACVPHPIDGQRLAWATTLERDDTAKMLTTIAGNIFSGQATKTGGKTMGGGTVH